MTRHLTSPASRRHSVWLISTVTLALARTAPAMQAPDSLPPSVYARAELFMGHKMSGRILRDRVDIHWLEDKFRFWYGVETAEGTDRYLVDPVRNTKELLVDRVQLARALSAAIDSTVEAARLGLTGFELSADQKTIEFSLGRRFFRCELAGYRCSTATAKPRPNPAVRRSPDEKLEAFARNHNIYVRRVGCDTTAPDCTTQLTTDGTEDWAYGRGGTFGSITAQRAGTPRSSVVGWSPDSRKLAVMRWDARGVEKLHYISSTTIRPELFSVRQSLPADSAIERYDIYVLDVVDKTVVRVATEQIPWVRGGATEGLGTSGLVQWSPKSDHFFFLSNDRGPKRLSLMLADATTGQVRRLVSDTTTHRYGAISEYVISDPTWRQSEAGDVYWMSERDGPSHLYRFDLTGKLVARVTSGDWNVLRVDRFDREKGLLFIRGTGRERDQFARYQQAYRVKNDGTGLTLLTPEPGDHNPNYSPDGRFFVDTYSTPETPPVMVLRSADNGRAIRELERADVSYPSSLGWKPVTMFHVVPDDNIGSIDGIMWKPTNFDSTKHYPIIDFIYPMPLGNVRTWSFASPSGDQQALAELGFIVVQIQPRGVRDPSRAVRDYYRNKFAGRYGEGTLPDHVTALKHLAARHSWIDLSRVGVYGTSGGGFVSTAAMLRHPDIFKVAVSFAGNHDDRTEHIVVGDSWRGLFQKDPNGQDHKDNYELDANYLLAKNLKGKLMLVHGDLDEAVHPSMSIRMASALIDAGKRFDFMILPDMGHTNGGWFGARLMFDYFVHNLLGLEPPDYTFTGVNDPVGGLRRRSTATPR